MSDSFDWLKFSCWKFVHFSPYHIPLMHTLPQWQDHMLISWYMQSKMYCGRKYPHLCKVSVVFLSCFLRKRQTKFQKISDFRRIWSDCSEDKGNNFSEDVGRGISLWGDLLKEEQWDFEKMILGLSRIFLENKRIPPQRCTIFWNDIVCPNGDTKMP